MKIQAPAQTQAINIPVVYNYTFYAPLLLSLKLDFKHLILTIYTNHFQSVILISKIILRFQNHLTKLSQIFNIIPNNSKYFSNQKIVMCT